MIGCRGKLSALAPGLLAWMVWAVPAWSQFVVHDPASMAQSIANSTREMVYTSRTAATMLENFQQTVKIYEQGREYFEALRKVNDLVRSARKVRETVLMVEELSRRYVETFPRLVEMEAFTTGELTAIASGYAMLLERSSGVLEDLNRIVSLTTLRMNDKERLDVVDDCHAALSHLQELVDYYSRKNLSVGYLRQHTRKDRALVAGLYHGD